MNIFIYRLLCFHYVENLPIEELLKRYGGAFDNESVTANKCADAKEDEKPNNTNSAKAKSKLFFSIMFLFLVHSSSSCW